MKLVSANQRGLLCEDSCNSWYHAECMGIKPKRYRELNKSNDSWSCNNYKLSAVNTSTDRLDVSEELKNSVILGDMKGVECISRTVSDVFNKGLDEYRICSCSLLVRRELIITIRHFTEKSSCDSFAITSFLIMIPFILPKT